jgi:subfamily B ATP-binding cassette protein MsbA
MKSLSRLIPFIWPYRWRLVLSVVCATLVAMLWATNLSAVFPVVKTLFDGQAPGEYVALQTEEVKAESARLAARSTEIQAELRSYQAAASVVKTPAHIELINERATIESKRGDLTRELWVLSCVDAYVIPWVPTDAFNAFALIVVLVLVATFLKGLLVFLQEVLVCSTVELTTVGVRDECFRHTLTLDYQTLMNEGTAKLTSRITYDTNVMASTLSFLGGKVVREPLKAIACIAFAFYVKWQLTLLALLFLPLIGWFLYKIGNKLRRASKRLMDSMSRIYKSLDETLSALKIVIAFNGARRHQDHFRRENRGYYHRTLHAMRIRALSHPVTELMGVFAVFLTLLPGSYLVLRGTTSIWGITLTSDVMTVADLVLLYVLLVGALDPLRKLSHVYSQLQQTVAATDRIFSFIDQESRVVEAEQPKTLPRLSKSIVFDKVTFTYAGNDDDAILRAAALRDISVKVRAGEVIAVVGANGSGKSTLVSLLPRFFDPDEGTVLIDGVNIRDVRLQDLRKQISIVTQETMLFDGTIEENIRYGKPEATANEIHVVTRQAAVTPIIEEFPEGLQTQVGENGQALSGGQRQRIALARAMLRDPAVLILDEATSAVDAESETLIHEALKQYVDGRTVFLITHSVSPSLLGLVVRIFVMDDGELIATGSHAQLLETCVAYQRLYQTQSLRRTG